MASDTGGVKTFSLQGRLYRERERLTSMTDAEREWRKQFLKDQILSHNEPKVVPEMYKTLYNPIRRMYVLPLNTIHRALTPVIGDKWALGVRVVTGKLLMGIALVYIGAYYIKYNGNDWTKKGGWRIVPNRPRCVPGDPDFPKVSDRKVGADYGSRGFKNSPI